MGVLYVLGPETDWLDERVDYRDAFTDTVAREWRLPALDVCFLCSFGESIGHVCLITRGEMVATLKRRVRFTDIVSLNEPLSFEELAAEMPRNLYQHVDARRNVD